MGLKRHHPIIRETQTAFMDVSEKVQSVKTLTEMRSLRIDFYLQLVGFATDNPCSSGLKTRLFQRTNKQTDYKLFNVSFKNLLRAYVEKTNHTCKISLAMTNTIVNLENYSTQKSRKYFQVMNLLEKSNYVNVF